MILLKNGYVNIDNELTKKQVLIENDKIIAIEDEITCQDCMVIDVKEGYITCGAVDVHVHLREPGFTDKETIKSGSLSSLAGGVTTIMAMPNTKPVTDSIEHLQTVQNIINKDSKVRIFPYSSVSVGQMGKELVNVNGIAPLVKGFSDDGVGVNNLELLKEAMALVKQNDSIIASHLEAENLSTTPKAELVALERELLMAKESGVKYHLCHLSLKESFKQVEKALKSGADITCEVTPHHLFLNEEDIVNANFKMNPPLRTKEDMLATKNAVKSGIATIIATDHAPHTEEEKSREYNKCPNGIIGLETLFPLVYTNLVMTKEITLTDMENLLTVNPAKRFNLPYGQVKVGGLADLCVLDVNNEREYKKENIKSKGKNSPFIGAKLHAFNTLTIINGVVVYNNLTED